MNEYLRHALDYAAQGFSIIPLRPRDKKPLFAWQAYQHRRPTEHEITAWWFESPDANLGVVTGAISGLVVIDVDSTEAKDKLKDLFPGFDFSVVPRSRTGKGWQLFFQHPGVTVPNRVGVVLGLDLRGDGGYIVAPPSVHPNGKQYKWESPINGELPELPIELFTLISYQLPAAKTGIAKNSIQPILYEGSPKVSEMTQFSASLANCAKLMCPKTWQRC